MKSLTLLIAAIGFAAICQSEVVVDLKTGRITDVAANPNPVRSTTGSYSNAYVTVTVTKIGTCPATPYEARVDVNFKPSTPAGTPQIKRANFTVEYEGPTEKDPNIPYGWVTHIADDPTNNGYGGGNGLDGVAEMQIVDQNLTMYSNGIAAGVVDAIFTQQLRLANGSMRFEVSDQLLTIGQPYTDVDGSATKRLFQIPDAKNDYRIYAGFNRVVANGVDRKGCGARRVLVDWE